MSYLPARPPVRDRRLNRQERERAFTLIELLVVIGIIAILSAITLGVVKGVNERAAIGQAKTELAALAQALEGYKRQYGDYPQTTTASVFLQSLIGKTWPTGSPMLGKQFIEITKFTTSADPFSVTTATLQDPWGRDYLYYYYTLGTPTITMRGYVLFSRGPDNAFTAPLTSGATGGNAQLTAANNLDNIYSNQ